MILQFFNKTDFIFYNFLQESYNNGGGRERSLESKSPRHPSLEVKKAKLEAPCSPAQIVSGSGTGSGNNGGTGSGGDPYGLYLYQTWAAATQGKGPMPPAAMQAAAMQAWSNHYAQAVKVKTYFYYYIVIRTTYI